MEPKVLRVTPYNKYVEIRYIEVMPDVVVRGAFARRDIKKGTKIEESPVVPIYKNEDWQSVRALESYVFDWEVLDENDRLVVHAAVSLGIGALFNHSSEPNIEHENHELQFFMEFFTTRKVKKGEELVHDYGWGEDDGKNDRYLPVDKFHRPMNKRKIARLKREGKWDESEDAERTMGWDEFTNV